MWKLTLPVALFAALALSGCQREGPAAVAKPGTTNATEIKPFLVTTNAGIDHEFYRDISLDAFFKMLPRDSVDCKSGKTMAVFCLPLLVVEGETKVVPIND